MTNYTTMQKLFVTLNVINNPMRLGDAKLFVNTFLNKLKMLWLLGGFFLYV